MADTRNTGSWTSRSRGVKNEIEYFLSLFSSPGLRAGDHAAGWLWATCNKAGESERGNVGEVRGETGVPAPDEEEGMYMRGGQAMVDLSGSGLRWAVTAGSAQLRSRRRGFMSARASKPRAKKSYAMTAPPVTPSGHT